MSAEEVLVTLDAMARYGTGRIGFSGLMETGARFMKGVPEQQFVSLGESLFEKHLARRIYPEARDIIRAHQAKGHTVAIVSSATIYQIAPAAVWSDGVPRSGCPVLHSYFGAARIN